ncbi:MAG: TldD/PmbA family protein [Nocardioidaceae bacterium]|nr:TldD/PmbA family protein [Nocardioidaceae bacterium]
MITPQALLDAALESTTADQCMVLLRHSSTANLRWANNTLTTNGVMTDVQATVISVVEGSQGAAAGVLTRSATTPSQITMLVSAADEAARAASPAADGAPLPDSAGQGDFDETEANTGIDVFTDFAERLGQAFGRAIATQQLLYGYVEHDVTTTYLASSTGLRLRHEQPTGHIGITQKPGDLSTSAWVGQAVEQIDEIDVEVLTDELTRRVGWAKRRVDLPAGRYETILPPTAMADLAIYAYWVSSARDAHEGQTVFSDPAGGTRVGQRLAKPGVRMHSDPHFAGLAACPFVVASSSSSTESVFDNGLPLTPTDWIGDGVLKALSTSRHTARLTELADNPAIDNLILSVDGGSGSVEDLVAATDRGLLLTCLWYIREVDPHTLLLTGLTRDGVYLVEGGEVVGAVNNFRFNESPIDLLSRFDAAGETVRSFSREWGDYFPRTATPPLRIPDFNMSTVSQAS